jgi:hypothetical protein
VLENDAPLLLKAYVKGPVPVVGICNVTDPLDRPQVDLTEEALGPEGPGVLPIVTVFVNVHPLLSFTVTV